MMTPNTSRISIDSVRVLDDVVALPTDPTKTCPDENNSAPRRSRSVNDFDTDQGLLAALQDNSEVSAFSSGNAWEPVPSARVHDDDQEADAPNESLDWVVNNANPDISHAQSLGEELNRLKALRSYLILDEEREASFERLTGIASRMFHVPICLVSLVDLGRQWFMSNRGLGQVRETPRKVAFCAHAILSKEDLLIVEDATADDRFTDNPLVTGAPHIRFYAGAPLICPEGYKIGTLCLIDTKTRPGGLCLEEKQNLRELAALVVDSMVERRRNKLLASREQSNLIACTAHDILTPLNGAQLSLSLLSQEENLTKSQLELVKTASSCCNVMGRICRRAVDSYRKTEKQVNTAATTTTAAVTSTPTCIRSSREIVVADWVKNLQMVMEPYPKSVPLFVTVDPSVPTKIISDDLKIFRSAVNFLTNACRETTSGSVRLKLKVKNNNTLVFECCDTGPGVDVELYPLLFKPINEEDAFGEETDYENAMACVKWDKTSKELLGSVCHAVCKQKSGLGLYSVANNIGSLGGDYGFRPNDDGSIFWFSIPLVTPKEEKNEISPPGSPPQSCPLQEEINKPPRTTSQSELHSDSSEMEMDEQRRVRRALVIDDSLVIRKSISRALSKLGFEVRQAVNGMEGLQELQGSVFDVVLCDFLMPVMDGLDCVQQYRAWEETHRPWFRQHICGISAHASPNDVKRGMIAGMDDFLPKPVSYKSLKSLEENVELNALRKRLDDMAKISSDPLSTLLDSSSGSSLVSSESDEVCVPNKKRKHTDTQNNHDGPVCLIADGSSGNSMSLAIKECGWNTSVVHNGQDALRLLKMRKWDAVFLNDELPDLNGIRCMERFREWEEDNRVSRQTSVFLVSSNYVPSLTSTECAVYPKGFDGAVGKPIRLPDLNHILDEATRNADKFEIVLR